VGRGSPVPRERPRTKDDHDDEEDWEHLRSRAFVPLAAFRIVLVVVVVLVIGGDS